MDVKLGLLGVVLCGGQSSRMGVDKSWLNYHGMPQREYVRRQLSKLCEETVFSVSAENERTKCDIPDNIRFQDNGPMSGLLSVHLAYPEHDLMILGCDYPLLPLAELRRLKKEFKTGDSAICFSSGNPPKPEPLIAIYSANFLRLIEEKFKNEGENSLKKILQNQHVKLLKPMKEESINSIDSFKDSLRAIKIIDRGF